MKARGSGKGEAKRARPGQGGREGRPRARWGLMAKVGLVAAALAALLLILRPPEEATLEGAGTRLASAGGAPLAAAKSAEVERLGVRVVRTLPHDREAFTQGLLYHDGRFYESTGLHGRSSLRRWEPESGEIERIVELPARYFGEGLARVEDRLFQLTWREGTAFVWSLETLELLGQFHYRGEGWGLTFDGEHLVMSDGSASLTFRDPETFEAVRRLEVTLEGRPYRNLNELEFAEGSVWANVLPGETVVRIDPVTGEITAVVDASELVPPHEPGIDVMNGVAYNPESGTFFLTGKLWPVLYEVELVPAPD